jgi:hypothetical protein
MKMKKRTTTIIIVISITLNIYFFGANLFNYLAPIEFRLDVTESILIKNTCLSENKDGVVECNDDLLMLRIDVPSDISNNIIRNGADWYLNAFKRIIHDDGNEYLLIAEVPNSNIDKDIEFSIFYGDRNTKVLSNKPYFRYVHTEVNIHVKTHGDMFEILSNNLKNSFERNSYASFDEVVINTNTRYKELEELPFTFR